MAELAVNILARTYAGFLARGALAKFDKGILLTDDQSAASVERLVGAMDQVTPNASSDLGMYAYSLANAAILEGIPNMDSLSGFTQIRKQNFNLTAENAISEYVWEQVSGITKAIQVYGGIRDMVFAAMDKCRSAIESTLVIKKHPVNISLFTWGALADGTFAHQAMSSVVEKTTFTSPTGSHIAMVIRAEQKHFSDAWDLHQAEVLGVLSGKGADEAIPTSGKVAVWIASLDAFINTLGRGDIPPMISALTTAMEALAFKTYLDDEVDGFTDEEKGTIQDFLPFLIRFIVSILGAVQFQRETLLGDVVIMAGDATDPALPMVLINGDQKGCLEDADLKSLIIRGMWYFFKSGLSVPARGFTAEQITDTLTYYADEGATHIDNATSSDEINLNSRASNLVVPILTQLFYDHEKRLENRVDVGNVTAHANAAFVRMTGDTESPVDYLVNVLIQQTGSEVLSRMAAIVQATPMPLKEAGSLLMVDDLISDYFVAA